MERKYGEFVGVDNVHAALILQDTADAYIAETPEYLAPTAEIVSDVEIENTPTYYDNAAGFNYVSEGVSTLTITFSGVPADKAAKYLGKHYDPASGRVVDSGQPTPPYVALSFRFSKGPDGYRYYQYLKGTFSGGSEEAATKTGSVDVRTYQMTYTAVVTARTWQYGSDPLPRPVKRIFGDTTDAAFDPTGWFLQVQTPDTAVSPGAIAITSSTPTSGATLTEAPATLTLDCNNPVSAFSAILMRGGVAVPVNGVLSADKKQIILTPAASLTDGEYTLAFASITDVYGQSVKNHVINFTVDIA